MKKNKIITFLSALLFVLIFTNNSVRAEETTNVYNGDLGYTYSSTSTEFKIWSTSASEIIVNIEGYLNKKQSLIKDDLTNVWVGYVSGDLSGCEYYYSIKYENGEYFENVLDPYGKFLNNDKTRNVVYKESVVSTDEWFNIKNNLRIEDRNKIIYGINVESFANSDSWNGQESSKGKLLSLNETGTKYNNISTGFDHVKNLGVTYIELADLNDQSNPFVLNNKYVSGSLSYSGNVEFKEVIASYYRSNIGVIVSFDLSNFSSEMQENFLKIDREYYSNSQGQQMLKKYIKDTIIYWVKEYKLSGIKIENMASFDVDFINDIEASLTEINKDIFIYGDGNYSQANDTKAGENSLDKLNNLSMINGSLNYALLGSLNDKDTKGLLDGNYDKNVKESLKFAFLSSANNGEIDYSLVGGISNKGYWKNSTSYQIVNYLGSRDGLSIYDKLIINNITSSGLVKQKAVLGFGALMISGGIPYIEAGNEFLISYYDFEANTDSICTTGGNNPICFHTKADKKIIDWSFAYENSAIIDSFKSLSNFRKSDNVFIQNNIKFIEKYMKFYEGEEGTLGYVLKNSKAYVNETKTILVLFNYSNNRYSIDDYKGKGWEKSYQYNSAKRENDNITMTANSMYFAQQVQGQKINQWILLFIVVGVIGGLYYVNIILNRKLVEKHGYDIKEINKKYRPFIKRKNKNKEEIVESDEGVEKNIESNDDDK